ncbi:MAG: helix-turn-helix transcriptional regulator [Armatimonadetes bacterium]|nr:helix-turn-helix transcriptional regulator [Armatimonadota bacterium]
MIHQPVEIINGATIVYRHAVLTGEFAIESMFEEAGITVSRQVADRRKSMSMTITRKPGYGLAILIVRGTLMVQRASGHSFRVATPNTLLNFESTEPTEIFASRGIHEHLVITWKEESVSGLTEWLTQQISTEPISLVHGSLGTDAGRAIATIIEAVTKPARATVPTVIGLLSFLIAVAHGTIYRPTLTDFDVDFPAPLEALVAETRSRPSANWALKDAAKFAGYSPFHLSRTFRNLVGYGFPEFVDRCRTESVVEKMGVAPHALIDELAMAAGFGSTQALRDAFRDYLGFLPSEIRGTSESDSK